MGHSMGSIIFWQDEHIYNHIWIGWTHAKFHLNRRARVQWNQIMTGKAFQQIYITGQVKDAFLFDRKCTRGLHLILKVTCKILSCQEEHCATLFCRMSTCNISLYVKKRNMLHLILTGIAHVAAYFSRKSTFNIFF